MIDLLRRAWDALDTFKQAYPENWQEEDEQVLKDLMRADLKLSEVKLKWVGLTDEEINSVAINNNPLDGIRTFARAIEAKLKQKNAAVGHVDLRYGWNEGDIRALVEALGKVRDGTGLYLCYRPVDVFQDWFLAFMEEAEKQWKKEKNT